MAIKRSVTLQGDPIVTEDGVATAAIKPGYLVQGVSYNAAQSINDTRRVPAVFALEREELGEGSVIFGLGHRGLPQCLVRRI